MNTFALSGILIGVNSSIMAVFMFWTFLKSKERQHFLWGAFCVSAAFWGWGAYKIATTTDINVADFWWRITHIGVIFIPVFFTHFVYTFLKIKRPKFIIAIYALGVFFLTTNFINNLFIANMRWTFGQFYYDSPPGIFYIPFTLMFFGLVLYSHIELWLAYRTAKSLVRTRIKYFLWAMAVSFFGGSLSFAPVYKIDLYPVLNIAASFFPIIIAYAIIRYRLMDIRLIMRQSTVWLVSLVLAGGAGFGVLYLDSSLSILALLLSMILFVLIKFGMEILANKFFFLSWYNYQKTLRETARKLTSIIDLEKLSDLIIETIVKTMQIDKAALLLREKDKYLIQKIIGFKQENGLSLVRDNALTEHLEKTGKLVVYEELSLIGLDHLKSNMKAMGAQLCLPLDLRNKLLGIIVLGSKISGDAYTKQDIDLLETLASQGAIAIENAQLYNNMDEKVQEQIKNIQELMNVKSEFLNLASHQLRTPVSGIRAALSMIIEGSTTEEQTKDFLKDCYANTNRLVIIIKDILDAQSIAGKGLKLTTAPCSVEDIINEAIIMFKPIADQKGLYLNFEKPEEQLPVLDLDKSRLRGAIDDLVDNAIHYTLKGGVTIKIQMSKSKIQIIIQDTGIGIEKKELPILFKKFSRGRGGKSLNVNSSGLGLYIAKHIVELHNGTIDVFSQGKDKGTTFTISLPVEQE